MSISYILYFWSDFDDSMWWDYESEREWDHEQQSHSVCVQIFLLKKE